MHNQINSSALIERFFQLPDQAYVNQKTVSAVTGCSESKLERDRWAGTGLPYYKFGRQVRYKKSDVLQDIENSRRTSTTENAK